MGCKRAAQRDGLKGDEMTDKIIYVVSTNYEIDAVFDNRDDAEFYCRTLLGEIYIEEYPLNHMIQALRLGYRPYCIRMAYDGTVGSIERQHSLHGIEAPEDKTDFMAGGNMRTHVMSSDEKHAVKIANERRVRAITEGRWPGQGKHFKAQG